MPDPTEKGHARRSRQAVFTNKDLYLLLVQNAHGGPYRLGQERPLAAAQHRLQALRGGSFLAHYQNSRIPRHR
jgi:hypothetical protein